MKQLFIIMADYCNAYLWDEDNGLVLVEDIDTVLGKKYDTLFSKWVSKLYLADKHKLNWTLFNNEGRDLMRKLQNDVADEIEFIYQNSFHECLLDRAYYDGEKYHLDYVFEYIQELQLKHEEIWFLDDLIRFIPKMTQEQILFFKSLNIIEINQYFKHNKLH